MATLRLDAETLSRTRLSGSPMMEAVAWLTITAGAARHPLFGDPGAVARSTLTNPDVALLLDLLPRDGATYMPDVLTPQPAAMAQADVLERQLADIRSAPENEVAEQLFVHTVTHWGHQPPRRVLRLAETGRLQRRIADGLDRFWREALSPVWKQVRAALDHDIAEKTATMARHGVGRVLNTLHPRLGLLDSTLTFENAGVGSVNVTGCDFVLAPTVLGTSRVMIQVDTPGQAVLYYPARGAGTAPPRGQSGLARALGPVRAALLAELATPGTTTEIAARHGYSPATISYHLSALYETGLVDKQRDGRYVLYTRTDRATALFDH